MEAAISRIDVASETWAAVRTTCQARITVATEIVLRPGLPPHEYDTARGEIAAYRAVLALGEQKTVSAAADYSKTKDRSGI